MTKLQRWIGEIADRLLQNYAENIVVPWVPVCEGDALFDMTRDEKDMTLSRNKQEWADKAHYLVLCSRAHKTHILNYYHQASYLTHLFADWILVAWLPGIGSLLLISARDRFNYICPGQSVSQFDPDECTCYSAP